MRTESKHPSLQGRIACVGDVLLDVVITAKSQSDGMAGGIHVRAGGSSANVAAWASQYGAPAAWVGSVGDDLAGKLLLSDLEASGVIAVANIVGGAETGTVLCRLGTRGQRIMASARQAAVARLSEAQLERLGEARAIHLTGYLLTGEAANQVPAILRKSQELGIPISFDPSTEDIVTDFGAERLNDVFRTYRPAVIFANRREALSLTGIRGSEPAALCLAGLADVAIVKLGGHGSIVATHGSATRVPPRRVATVDSTGAGDSFAGVWLAEWLKGADPVAAAQSATLAAAQAIQRIGARPLLTVGAMNSEGGFPGSLRRIS